MPKYIPTIYYLPPEQIASRWEPEPQLYRSRVAGDYSLNVSENQKCGNEEHPEMDELTGVNRGWGATDTSKELQGPLYTM